MNKYRTRFAPSPTGFMHIGNLRSAIFSYLIIKHYNGDFVLRIEDTDQARKVDGAIEFIYNTLNLCSLAIDEGPLNGGSYGPYIQSERLMLYQEYAHKLVEMGKAYYCFCDEARLNNLRNKAELEKRAFQYDGFCKGLSKEEIAAKIASGEKYVIRQLMPKDNTTSYEDVVYGTITVENKILEDQILLKSDGYPTYNFANVIDDHLMGITHIARGNEYLMSTPKYNLLYDSFGWTRPTYIHLPLVLGEDGQKLSKRNGDASFMDLYNQGYLPEAIVNYLSLLGWSDASNQEIFSLKELIEKFDPTRISKSPSTYDVKKLNWVNACYIKELDDEKYLALVLPFLYEAYPNISDEEWLRTLALLYKKHLSYGREIVDETKMFFTEDIILDEEAQEILNTEGVDNTLEVFKSEIENISNWTIENINTAINNTKEKAAVKGKMLFMPIRIKTSGKMHGPELDNTIYLLGKTKVLSRLNNKK